LEGKSLPYHHFTDYFKVHARYLAPFTRQMEYAALDQSLFEKRLPLIFFKLHECLTRILKEARIIEEPIQLQQQEPKVERYEASTVVEKVLKIQSSLLMAENPQDIRYVVENVA
jgi:hypothetical protein